MESRDSCATFARLTSGELSYIVTDCGARAFITSRYKADQAAEVERLRDAVGKRRPGAILDVDRPCVAVDAPDAAIHRDEFAWRGIPFDPVRFCEPFITDESLAGRFGDDVDFVKEHFLTPADGMWKLNDAVSTQRKIAELPAEALERFSDQSEWKELRRAAKLAMRPARMGWGRGESHVAVNRRETAPNSA